MPDGMKVQRAQLQSWIEGPAEPRGGMRRYEVLAMTAGDGNGLEYLASTLQAAAVLFEGAAVFVDHPDLNEMWSMTGNRSLSKLLGVLTNVRWGEVAQGIEAVLQLYPGPHTEWFSQLVDAYLAERSEGREVPRVGLSAVVDVKIKGRGVVSIDRVVSVDAVFDPARGGEFIRALNQRREGGTVEDNLVNETVTTGTGGASGVAPAAPPIVPVQESEQTPAAAGMPTTGGEWRQMSDALLEVRLQASGLPSGLQKLIRQQVGGRGLVLEEIDAGIEAARSAWAQALSERGPVVRDLGRPRVEVGLSEPDRLQAVMDKLCGLQPASEALQGIRPVSGIRELYLMLTGDYNFQGVYDQERVALANVTTATMTSLVKNAFNKVILDWFNTVDLWWRPIVSEEDFLSMKDLTLITLGGFGDLPTVAEGAAYTELSWSDAEEVVSFVKKGAYVGVTLEMMDQDETRKFQAIPRKIAIAGFRTLSSLVSALFTDNSGVGPYWPSSQSVLYLFSATYGNLGSTALSAAAWDTTIQAMWKMAEATSSKRMGIRPAFCLVPIELEKTALTIFESQGEPGTADNDANVRRGSARVIAVPDWTNTANWAAVADPRMVPCVVVGYRFGRVPEVYTAGEQTIGSMFTNDEMRIKARFVVAVGVGEYRGLYKHNI